MSPRICQTLKVFHHRVDRCLSVMKPFRDVIGRWVYPPLEDSMAETLQEKVKAYALFRHNIIVQYIATRPILELCLTVERSPGTWVT